MKDQKITFALFFGNRGFFPGEVIASARREVTDAVTAAGYGYIVMEESLTRYGAVETIAEGKKYAEFLAAHRGEYDGVLLCLPNFGDENGMLVALKDAGVPILVQAYPDEIGKMDFAHRRDAYCGKFAVCNILRQADIPYSLTERFTVHPSSEEFAKELHKFAAVCRVVRGMRSCNIGAFGARTTAFKTVRTDEIAFQKKGINIETLDLSEVFDRVKRVTDEEMNEAKARILKITRFAGFPAEKLDMMARIEVAFESLIADYDLSAVAVRCWNEFEVQLGVAPCTSLSLLGDMGIPAACEVDLTNAVMMYAFALASGHAGTLLDVNNNYGDDPDRAIMFHCGPVPVSMCEEIGNVEEHLMFKKSYGDGSGVGINKTRMKAGDVTFGSIRTENGKILAFAAEGEFTDDPIEDAFFGSGKVVYKKGMDGIANYMANNGYKHHLCVTHGKIAAIVLEAFTKYLGYETDLL